ncbi:MAG: TetR/AcrR family transcriptional regulator [Myxococcota bacterium]
MIEAAARILIDDGYDRLTTNRAAERAGVSIGTLYQYFGNKEAIVEALVQRIADERISAFGDTLRALAEQDLPLHEAVEVLLDGTLAAMRVRPELSRRLLLEAPRGGRLDLEHAWVARCIELVRAVMYRRRDRFREGDVELMASVAVTGAFAVLQDAAAHRPELLEGDVLRDELTLLASRYLSPE